MNVDPALLPLLEAPNDLAARHRLGELLERDAAPLAWQVIRGHLRGPDPNDLEDVHAGVLLSLARHFRGIRRGDEAPIQSFVAYVASVSHNACHAFLRQRFPERARLGSRTRYVLTRDATLAFWEGNGREWLCGKAAWRDAACDAGSAARLRELSGRLGPLPFPDLVRAIVDRLQGPARFEDLVDAIAAIQGIADPPRRGSEAEPVADLSDPAPSAEQALAERGFLSRLWAEIQLLPGRQRAALLLNLRDGDGRGMIELFPLTGTAALEDVAQALEMPAPELRALWDDLPQGDDWIAARLQLTRRQVINLRKCARERLARRMKDAGRW